MRWVKAGLRFGGFVALLLLYSYLELIDLAASIGSANISPSLVKYVPSHPECLWLSTFPPARLLTLALPCDRQGVDSEHPYVDPCHGRHARPDEVQLPGHRIL